VYTYARGGPQPAEGDMRLMQMSGRAE
jgi:hypothetical protein